MGVGIDIVKIEKLRYAVERPNAAQTSFIRKTYTSAEIAQAQERPVPLNYYATRFAAKEAVFKALRISGEGVILGEIEVLDDADGKPSVTLHGYLSAVACQKGIAGIDISLSYEDAYAIAFAVTR